MATSIVTATPPLLIKGACLGFIQKKPSSVEIRSQLTYYYTARIPARHKIQVRTNCKEEATELAISGYSPTFTVQLHMTVFYHKE